MDSSVRFHTLRKSLPATIGLLVLAAGFGVSSLSAAYEGDAPGRVAVLFRAHDSHRQAASALKQDLLEAGYHPVLIELPEGDRESTQEQALQRLFDARPEIVATGGTKATLLALQALPDTSVVFFMVPNALDAPFTAPDSPDRRRVAGVTTDTAPDDQIRWLTTLCPQVKTIGVLTSRRSEATASAIDAVGTKRAVKVVLIEASKDEFMPAIDALNAEKCDAVLMIPDSRVYNSVSVQRLLVWGIRQKRPVSAFSAHVVKAGALTGQYCDNQAVGRQTARLIRQVLQGADISSIGLQYPDRVNHAFNERTAEMIGIALDQHRPGQTAIR